MIRIELSELSKTYTWLGFNARTQRPTLRGVLYSLTIPFLLINEIAYVVFYWDDVEKRVNGLNGLITYVVCAMFAAALLFMWNKTKLMIKVIEDDRYQSSFGSKKCTELIKKTHESAIKMNTAWFYLINICMSGALVTSVVIFLIKVIQIGAENVTARMLYLPYPFYYPDNYDTLPCYFISFVIQYFFAIQMARNTYFVLVGSYVCMQVIEGDLKLLQLSVEEMDGISGCNTTECSRNSKAAYCRDLNLKQLLAHFVQNHYYIHKKVKETIEGIQMIAFTLSHGMALIICTQIYILVKGNNFSSKLVDGSICVTALYILYRVNVVGENISNEDEMLHQALYHSDWIGKPMWFKKSLQIIMARTNKTIEIKSPGLFIFNLKSYNAALQAAYSFYNMLNNFSK